MFKLISIAMLAAISVSCGSQEDPKNTSELAGLGKDGVKVEIAAVVTDRKVGKMGVSVFDCDATDYVFYSSSSYQMMPSGSLGISVPKDESGCLTRVDSIVVDGLTYVPAKDADWSSGKVRMEHWITVNHDLGMDAVDSVIYLEKAGSYTFVVN